MNTRPAITFVLLLLAAVVSSAEDIKLPVLQSAWSVRFTLPDGLTKVRETDGPDDYMYGGNSGRVNVSLFVQLPRCSGDPNSNVDAQACFRGKLPTANVLPGSIQTTRHSKYFRTMYATSVEVNGRRFNQIHVHLIFAHKERWGHLHVSVLHPTMDDVKIFDELEESFVYGEGL